MPGFVPTLAAGAGFRQHIIADGIDQSQILCQGNKFRRRDETQLRAVPADQCLRTGADILSALNIDDRLVIDLKLPVALHSGITHVLLHVQTASRYRIIAFPIRFHTVFTGLFRLIHGNIRFFDQICHGISGIRESDDAHTHGTVIICILQKPGFAEDLLNIFHNIFKPGITIRRNDNDEFVSTHTVTGILDAIDPFQCMGDGF